MSEATTPLVPAGLAGLQGDAVTVAAGPQGAVITTTPERLPEVCRRLREQGFDYLADFTAVSHPEPLRVVFRVWSTTARQFAQVVVPVEQAQPVCPTITPFWPAAAWQEREVWDLFGIRFAGNLDLRRILLPENWPGHPLLADYQAPDPNHLLPTIEPDPSNLPEGQTLINFGPQHPSTHGVLRLVVTLAGEEIMAVDPVLGYLHRGIEKLAESRTYPQVIPYTDRLDYVSGVLNNWPYVLAVESLLGVTPPRRAELIRVILGELARITSHLVWLGTFANDVGATSVFLYCFRERERALDLMEEVTGARQTISFFRIGGVPYDLPEGFAERTRDFTRYLRPRLDEYDALLTGNRIFIARAQGVGVLKGADVLPWAVSGPMARASGVAIDLRRSDPYSVYPEIDFAVALEKEGDLLARTRVRMTEMRESARIIEQALEMLEPGPVLAKVPRQIKPEPGAAYGRIESARGDYSAFVVSDGTPKPARVRFRSPSFANLQVLPMLCRGAKVADLIAILGGVDIILGEVDR